MKYSLITECKLHNELWIIGCLPRDRLWEQFGYFRWRLRQQLQDQLDRQLNDQFWNQLTVELT